MSWVIYVLYITSTKFWILINEKRHQVALFLRKVENKHKDENISTRESLPGVQGVSRNQKLSKKYNFCSFEVSLKVLIEKTLKDHLKT